MRILKRTVSLIICCVMMFAAMPLSGMLTADAATEYFEEGYTYTVSNGEATITSYYVSIGGAATIPSTLGGYPVTSIGRSVFSYCTSLESITIPDSVTSIGDSAFYDCESLTCITIPDGVTSIGDYAFCNCTSLTSIIIPDSVTSIGDDAFYGCYSLKRVDITDLESWLKIEFESNTSNPLCKGEKLYLNSQLVTKIKIPDGVTNIGDYAFYNCTSLTSITIPDSVTSIGDYAFYSCPSLTSITIPDSVTSIGDYAFYSCSSLTSITIPDSVTSIGDRAFYNCTSLTSINIHDGVTSIGDYAFYNCENLASITIPDSVTSIGDGAFYWCESLTSITIPDSVTSIGKYAFSQCTSLTSINIHDGVTSTGDYTFSYCESLTSINIPDSITSIGKGAFYDCESLTYINIPDSVTSMGDYAFYWCKSLTNINIPNSITSICRGAFYSCKSLTCITIPDSVTSIGEYAFYNCVSLTNINIPNGVTSISNNTFEDCASLTNITLPNSVTSIGDKAFYWCGNLTSITIPDSVTWIGNGAFGICRNLTIYTPKGSYAEQWAIENGIPVSNDYNENGDTESGTTGDCTWELDGTTLTISGSGYMGDYNSYGNQAPWGTDIIEVIIKDGVKSIGAYAFSNCSSLISITIPDNVTSISRGAFSDCSSLTSITIPNSVIRIVSNAFSGCPNLTIYTPKGSYAEQWAIERGFPVSNDYNENGDTESGTNVITDVLASILNKHNNWISADFITYGTGKSIDYHYVENAKYIDNKLELDAHMHYPVTINDCTLDVKNTKKIALVPELTYSFIGAVHANGKDILASELVTIDADKTDVEIRVYPADGASVGKYQLLQNNTVILENESGIFRFNSSQLEASDTYYVRIVNSDGKECGKIKINYENRAWHDIDISVEDVAKFDIPENVPIIGGKEIELSCKGVPINTVVEGDSIFVIIGGERSSTEGKWDFTSWFNFVDDYFDDLDKGANLLKKAKANKAMKGWNFWKGRASSGLDVDVETKLVGYCELQRDSDGEIVLKSGKIVYEFSGSAGCKWQTVLSSVPVVLQVKGESGAGITLMLGSADDGLYFDGDFDFKLLKITGKVGVGIVGVADGSIYASGEVNVKKHFRTGQLTASLKGDIGVCSTILFFEGKHSLWSGEHEIYNSLAVSNYSLRSLTMSQAELVTALSNEANYSVDRSYLAKTSDWLSTPRIQTYALRSGAYSADEITLLQSNIYNGAAPRTVTLDDGRRIMIWIADIAERTQNNHTAVVYSVYDPTTEYWSEPQIISDDGTADFYPQIATDGVNTYAVWCDSNTYFAGAATMTEVASCTEISYARFNADTGCFEVENTLMNDAYYDRDPQIFVNDGTCYISWVKNLSNSPLALGGLNEVYCAEIGEDVKITLSASVNKPITEQKVGIIGENVALAYIVDDDAELTTVNDSVIYAVTLKDDTSTDGSDDDFIFNPDDDYIYIPSGRYPPVYSSNVTPIVLSPAGQQTNIVFGNINGKESLIWNKNASLVAMDSLGGATQTLIDELEAFDFELISGGGKTAIVYSKQDAERSNGLYACVWSECGFMAPVCISRMYGAYIEDANGYIDENGNIRVVFAEKQIKITADAIDEATAIYDAKLVPQFDIAVSDVVYNEDGIAVGENMTVFATVENKGLYATEGLAIKILDNDGNVMYWNVLDKNLAIGEKAEISFDIPFPNITTVADFTLEILPLNGEDAEIADNSSELTIGYASLSMRVDKLQSANAQGAVIAVENSGRKDEKISLRVYEDDASGRLLGEYSLGTAESGKEAIYNFSPQILRELSPQSDILYFEIVSSAEEKYLSDNVGYLTYKMATVELSNGETVEYYYDVNHDDAFDIRDLVRMKKLLNDTENAEQNAGQDVSGDGTLDSADIADMRKRLIGIN